MIPTQTDGTNPYLCCNGTRLRTPPTAEPGGAERGDRAFWPCVRNRVIDLSKVIHRRNDRPDRVALDFSSYLFSGRLVLAPRVAAAPFPREAGRPQGAPWTPRVCFWKTEGYLGSATWATRPPGKTRERKGPEGKRSTGLYSHRDAQTKTNDILFTSFLLSLLL